MSRLDFEVARRRLVRAAESLRSARMLAENEGCDGCASLAFQVCFQAALGILALDGKGSSKRGLVQLMLVEECARQGQLSLSMVNAYDELHAAQVLVDYELEKTLPIVELPGLLDTAEFFVKMAEVYISQRERSEALLPVLELPVLEVTRAWPERSGTDIPARVKAAVLGVAPDAEVIVYGSRARGDFQPDSDWDFLVLCDEGEEKLVKDGVRDAVYALESGLMAESGEYPCISVFTHSRDYWNRALTRAKPFYKSVMREGMRV